MDKKTEVLRAYITKSLAESGYEPDERVFNLIERTVTLTERSVSEDEETRSGTIKEGSDGKITAEIFSFYNLERVSFHDLFGVLLDEIAILGMVGETKLKVGLAIAKIVHSFYPKLTHKVNDTDAKIMLAIYHVKDKSSFSIDTVAEAYINQHGVPIEMAQLQRSLDFLVKIKFLGKDITSGLFKTKQSMSYERE